MVERHWRLLRIFGALVLVFLYLSCAAKSEQSQVKSSAAAPKQTGGDQFPEPQRGYAAQGIQIGYAAARDLNLYDGKPHALLVAVYQLDGINGFKDLAKDEDGLDKLLQVERFDASVVGMNSFVVEPGENKTVMLDRAEKAKWIGIVAGYYLLTEQAAMRFYEIPIIVEKKGIYGFRKTVSSLGLLSVRLSFGPQMMQSVEGNP